MLVCPQGSPPVCFCGVACRSGSLAAHAQKVIRYNHVRLTRDRPPSGRREISLAFKLGGLGLGLELECSLAFSVGAGQRPVSI